MKRSVLPWLQPDIIWNNISDGKLYNKNVSILHNFTNSVIKDRRSARRENEQEEQRHDEFGKILYRFAQQKLN